MFFASTLVLCAVWCAVCVQCVCSMCAVWLCSVVSWWRAFQVCYSRVFCGWFWGGYSWPCCCWCQFYYHNSCHSGSPVKSLYFNFFSAFLLNMYLSPEIARSNNVLFHFQVTFSDKSPLWRSVYIYMLHVPSSNNTVNSLQSLLVLAICSDRNQIRVFYMVHGLVMAWIAGRNINHFKL
jgi:hypothetical protein